MSRIRIKFAISGIGDVEGELVRYSAPRTVEAVVKQLPVEGRAALWKGAEVYFGIPVKMGPEKPVERVEKGTIAYWPMGNSLCIFFENLEPYSPVNVIGQITRDLELFRKVKSGDKIKVERG